jgi:hypothetical protein
MRQYLAMQPYGQAKGFAPGLLGRGGPMFSSYGGSALGMNGDAASGKVVIQHFHCRSLTIGTWRRIGQSSMDLVIFYSPDKACVTYYINNESAGYKIEYPFAWIKNITLEQGDVSAAAEGSSQRSGGLIIEMTRAPKFYMDGSGSGGFYECGDFSEDQQASTVMVHQLGGPSKVLSGQLAKLISLEAYQNRHSIFDQSVFAVSAPVSPIHHRPASQPNHLMHPHSGIHLYPPHDPNAGLMGPPGPRGHKRQRSRSVPCAIDFSMLRGPMPSFLIQQDGQSAQPPMQDPAIFHPVPQHQHANGFAAGAPGTHLSLDTSAGYNLGVPFNGPLSAASATSPSDFGPPGWFNGAAHVDGLQQNHLHPNFQNGFLAVDPGAMLGTSHTPLSMVSHGDPAIVDHSPPLSGVGRSQSADMFAAPGDHSQLDEEGLYLSDAFNKQIALPFRGSMSEEPFHSPIPEGMFTFQTPPGNGPSEMQAHLNMSGPSQSNFQSPPGQQQDMSAFDSPSQHNQDSAIAFSTSSQGSQDQAGMFNSPKDGGVLYQDGKMYTSPGNLQQGPDDHGMFQQSPMTNGTMSQSFDMNGQPMYNFVDPTNLGQSQR